jgi:DNA-binding response OmpR family regulator
MRSGRIFLIDDDDDLRFTVALSLRDAGLDVAAFASADEAWPAILAQRPGAVFLDYRVEGMSAEELVRRLGALDDAPPVVLLSGAPDLADLARTLGALAWLGKPFALEELVSRARSALAHRR